MKNYQIGKWLTCRALLMWLVLPGLADAQIHERLIIFGDSLSDSGNFFAETGQVARAPFDPIPSAPYTMGGHHFSNGATWVEQLATNLGLNPSANPALVNPGQFTNYAFGRARARAGAPVFSAFDLATQVNYFLVDFDNVAPSDATYVIWIGANDARDAFEAGGDPGIVVDSITSIASNIGLLVMKGARRFVVLNVPNLGLVPAINQLPDPIPALATGFTLGYNQALSNALDLIVPTIILVGGELTRVDTFAILTAIVSDPAAAGLSNVTDSCLSFGVTGGFINPTPNDHLFWDAAHPTFAGHALLSQAVADVMTAP
jgi:outer membrane lipase/esterase